MNHVMQLAGWDSFRQGMIDFFQNGLGGTGLEGIAIAIMVIGLVCAAVSFVLHKFNPQSRMPGPVICLFVALVGGIASFGIERPMEIVKSAGEWVLSLF